MSSLQLFNGTVADQGVSDCQNSPLSGGFLVSAPVFDLSYCIPFYADWVFQNSFPYFASNVLLLLELSHNAQDVESLREGIFRQSSVSYHGGAQ